MGANSVLNYRIVCFCRNPVDLVLYATGPQVTPQNLARRTAAMEEYAPTTTLFKVWVTLYRHIHRPGKDIRCVVRAGNYKIVIHFYQDMVEFCWSSSRNHCNCFYVDRPGALRDPIDQLAKSFYNIVHAAEPGSAPEDFHKLGVPEFGPYYKLDDGSEHFQIGGCSADELETDLATFRESLFSPTPWTLLLFGESQDGESQELQEQHLKACLRFCSIW